MCGAFTLVGRLAFLQRLFTVGTGHLGRTNRTMTELQGGFTISDLWLYSLY